MTKLLLIHVIWKWKIFKETIPKIFLFFSEAEGKRSFIRGCERRGKEGEGRGEKKGKGQWPCISNKDPLTPNLMKGRVVI